MSDTPIVQPALDSISQPVADRFWAKVQKSSDPDGCWLWTAAKSGDGYARFNFKGSMIGAHRFAYEQAKGPIPDGMEIDHLCRVRHCVNPEHMEAVTHRVNMSRSEAPNNVLHRLGTCKRGHPINEQNTRFRKSGPRKGHITYCKICWHEKYAEKWKVR